MILKDEKLPEEMNTNLEVIARWFEAMYTYETSTR